MKSVVTLALKDLKLLWRDKFGLFWVLLFPLIYALFFGSIFSGRGDSSASAMKIAVADEDNSDSSRKYAERLEKSSALKVTRATRDDAREQVRKGDLVAYVLLKKGFGDSPGFAFGSNSSMELGIDPSRKAESGYLQGILVQASFEVMQEKFTDPAATHKMVSDSLADIDRSSDLPADQKENLRKFLGDLDRFVEKSDSKTRNSGGPFSNTSLNSVAVTSDSVGPRSAFEISFPSAILWGILGCAAAFAISIVTERIAGTFLRLRISPISRGQILAGKALACFIACVAVIVFLVAIGSLMFGVRITNAPGLLMGTLCTAACFVGVMMFMSVLGKTEAAVSGAGWAILTVFAMLGGGMVPLMFMPNWMQTLSNVSPVKWGILSLEGAIWRQFTVNEMLLPCAILLSVGAAFFAIGVKIFSRSDG